MKIRIAERDIEVTGTRRTKSGLIIFTPDIDVRRERIRVPRCQNPGRFDTLILVKDIKI